MSRPAARILIVSGPSGVGKSSVCRRLLDEDRMVLSVSATTRAPRGAEVEGRDYFFLTREEFERRAEAGEFLEWAEVHGTTLYGTPAAPVQDHLAAGRSVLLDIDVQGAELVRTQGARLEIPVSSVFLLPPSLDELRRRLEGRHDTAPEVIERRLEHARAEIARADQYDLQVVNDELDRAVGEIEAFLAG